MALMIDKETRKRCRLRVPEGDHWPRILPRLMTGSFEFWTVFGMALCLMKNYDPFQCLSISR